jgi:transglutaminase-like putative cysteine protease
VSVAGAALPRTARESHPLTLLLLAPLALAPALSFASAAPPGRLEPVPWLAALGLVFGLVLGRVRLPALLAHVLAVPTGLGLTAWVIASSRPTGTAEDGLFTLLRRLELWLAAAGQGRAGPDELLFLFSVAGLAWLVGYLAAFAVFRDANPWWAIVAGGSALLANAARAGRPDPYLYVFLAAALLLVVRLTALGQARRWRALGVVHPAPLPILVLPFGVAATGLLLGLAFLLPARPLQSRLLEPLRTRLETTSSPLGDARADVERALAEVRGQPEAAPYPLAGFAGTMTLQGEFRLSPEPIAHVAAARGRYWRAATYEQYTGRGWRNATARQPLTAAAARAPAHERRAELVQTVRVLAPRGEALLAAAQPRAVGVAATLEYPAGLAGDPLALDLVARIRAPSAPAVGDAYRVVSSIPTASEAELRAAGADYPAAVAERYGRAPETTGRVRALAQRLAPPALRPYERARAIERYLRSLRYDLRVPAPPTDRDGVDYFLFDSKVGYCDYFATAMAVLLRSAGVPARVASGYAIGEPDPGGGGWTVRDLHAHSWVEVYFPRYGWIEFEPSPNRPLPDRPSGPAEAPAAGLAAPEAGPRGAAAPRPSDPAEALGATPTPVVAPELADQGAAAPRPEGTRYPAAPWSEAATPYLAGLLALAGLAALARLVWGYGIDGLPPAEGGYARMVRLSRLFGRGPGPDRTPTEFAEAIAVRHPAAGDAARLLAAAFVESRWAGRTPAVPAASLAAAWRRVRGALLTARLQFGGRRKNRTPSERHRRQGQDRS